MIDKVKRSLPKLKDRFLPVAFSAILVILYLYIPFMQGHLSAKEEAVGAAPEEPIKVVSLTPISIKPLVKKDVVAGVYRKSKDSTRVSDIRKGPYALHAGAAPGDALKPRPNSPAASKAVFFGVEGFETLSIDTEPAITVVDMAPRSDYNKRIKDESQRKNEHKKSASVRVWPPDITRGDKAQMELSITFDGGDKATEAFQILNTLRARGIKTTIFLTGLFIKRHPGITRLIVLDGHEVGNHTMTHPHLTEYEQTRRQKTLPGVDKGMLIKELKETEEAFKEATGREMAPLWRAPYGEVNADIRSWAFSEGYLHVGWTYDHGSRQSLDTLDWVYDRSSGYYLSSDEIKDRIVSFGSDGDGIGGGIILMHLGTERQTDRAAGVLGEMVDELREMGYRFVKVSELIEGEKALSAAIKKKRGTIDIGRVTKEQDPGPS